MVEPAPSARRLLVLMATPAPVHKTWATVGQIVKLVRQQIQLQL